MNQIKLFSLLALLLIMFNPSLAQKEYQILRHVGYDSYNKPVFNGFYEIEGNQAADLFVYDDNMGAIEMLKKEGQSGYVIQYQGNAHIRLSDDGKSLILSRNGKDEALALNPDEEINKRMNAGLSFALAPMYPFVNFSSDGKSIFLPTNLPSSGQDMILAQLDLESGEYKELPFQGSFPNISGNMLHYITYAPGGESGLDLNILNLSSNESETLPIRMPGGFNILSYKPIYGDGSSVLLYDDKLYFFDYYSKKFELIANEDITDKKKFLAIYYSKINDELMYLKLSANGSKFLKKSIEITGEGELTWEDIVGSK